MGDLAKLKELDLDAYVKRWSRYDASELKDKLTGSSRAVIVASADGLLHQVNAALQHLQESLPEDDAELTEEQEACLDNALTSLKVSAQLCGELLAECHAAPPEALLNAAMQLHDHALLELGDVRPDVQDAVAKLCCSWWTCEAENREFLVSQALPYLLLRAISTGKASQVKACHAMRGALELLDFEDASINDMKRMLLQAAICPAFVSRPEGRKFLSCLLTVHPSMVQEVTSVIRNQIPAGRRSVLDAYGEVILRGWREAVGACLPEIETSLVQNLMLAALHGSSQSLVANIRRVLGELHRSKKLGGVGSVDSMLVRLYEPILFRALAASNAGVRRNALQLLLDAFPLLDPEASTEEQDEMLVRQFQCLSDALTDPCPLVRVAAAQGICCVLNLYWEIIPSATTAGYVSRLTGQLAFDAALPAVRVAVLEGLQLLVDNQHAQPVLKRSLPQLAPLMWDSSPRVREAMTDLLLCISTSRGLHFWEVVPLEVLLGQLADESQGGGSSTAQKLHQLLVPSYFPGPEEGVARVAALLKEHPAAGQAFCRLLVSPYLHYIEGGKGGHQVQVDLEDILSLASSLAGHLLEHPPVTEPASPPRKSRSRRGAAAAEAGGGAGAAAAKGKGGRAKRKKGPAAAAPSSQQQQAEDDEASTAAAAAAAEEDEAGETDVMAVGAADETPETWARLLAGLSEICSGIGMALDNELCDEADVAGLFPSDALQQLLAACPTPACEACVWAITEALPHTPAAKELLSNQLALLADGSLLPAVDAASAAAAGSGEGPEAQAAAVLACLAAGPSSGRLAAMLCAALGLRWADSTAVAAPSAAAAAAGPVSSAQLTPAAAGGRSRGGSRRSVVPGGGAGAPGDAAAEEGGDDGVACAACGGAHSGDRLVLCDGCDSGLHMDCLQPALEAVPEGDWLCPECCGQVRQCQMGREAALRCLQLLLLSDSGRALLLRSGTLQQAVPLLQQRAGEAAAAAAAQGGQQLDGVLGAVRAVLVYARAAVHLLSQGLEEEPTALARGAASIIRQVAKSCSLLQQLQAPAGSSSGAIEPPQQQAQLQLLAATSQLQGLLSDLWAAMGLLGAGCLQNEPAVAAAATAAAAAGQSLLSGLASLGQGLLVQQQAEEEEDGVGRELQEQLQRGLVLNTHLLRALLSLPAHSPALSTDAQQQVAPGQQQQQQGAALRSWLLCWLRLLSTSSLASAAAAGGAVAAAASRRDLPVLLSALLPAGRQQREAAGGSSGSGVSVGVDAWLPLVVQAAAEVQEEEEEDGGDREADADQDAQSEGDQGDGSPAGQQGGRGRKGTKRAAAGRKAGPGPATVKVAAAKLGLPPLVTSLLAAAQQKQVHTMLSSKCVGLAISAGQRGDWTGTLGALRLSRVLGASAGSLSGEEAAQLQELRQQAVEDNGTAAHLFCEALGRLLPVQ